MERISNSRQIILKEAYKLFLLNNVEKVTIAKIEKATDKIRGTIFYHFKDKQAIFDAVVEEIFFPSISFSSELIETAFDLSFEQFLNLYKNCEQRFISQINNWYDDIENPGIAYYNFISQAYKSYAGFNDRFNEIIQMDYNCCKYLIQTAQEKNELKNLDPQKIALLFLEIGSGTAYHQAFSPLFNSDCKIAYSQIYQLLRKN
jgi:AcrR family transcriptional regulator